MSLGVGHTHREVAGRAGEGRGGGGRKWPGDQGPIAARQRGWEVRWVGGRPLFIEGGGASDGVGMHHVLH